MACCGGVVISVKDHLLQFFTRRDNHASLYHPQPILERRAFALLPLVRQLLVDLLLVDQFLA